MVNKGTKHKNKENWALELISADEKSSTFCCKIVFIFNT